MTLFAVTVNKGKEFMGTFGSIADTKVDACMEILVFVKDTMKMDMKEFAELTATAKVVR